MGPFYPLFRAPLLQFSGGRKPEEEETAPLKRKSRPGAFPLALALGSSKVIRLHFSFIWVWWVTLGTTTTFWLRSWKRQNNKESIYIYIVWYVLQYIVWQSVLYVSRRRYIAPLVSVTDWLGKGYLERVQSEGLLMESRITLPSPTMPPLTWVHWRAREHMDHAKH